MKAFTENLLKEWGEIVLDKALSMIYKSLDTIMYGYIVLEAHPQWPGAASFTGV